VTTLTPAAASLPAVPASPAAGPGPPRRILCAIDFSPSSLAVVEQAVLLARACRGEVTVLFVVPYETPSRATPRRLPPGIDDAISEDLGDLLAPARAAGIPIRACLKVGTPAHEILEEIRRTSPDIVVIGTHGRHGVLRRFLGSVAAEVLRDAPCPVLTVGTRRKGVTHGERDAVVCAVSLDDSSPDTVAYAAGLARATGGRLTLLHVEPTPEPDVVGSARRLHALAGLARDLPPGGVEEAIAAGEPAHQIVRAAVKRRALLVVVGAAAGHGPGAVADRVIRGSPCAVVAVRSPRAGPP
jgi:nucleotide-binding universal stress UspA family protein